MTTYFEQRMANLRDLNPFGVALGQPSYSILIDCNATLHDGRKLDWFGRVVIPVELNGTELELEEAATIAFGHAQHEGLEAQLMSLCSMYCWDDEEEGWVQFL